MVIAVHEAREYQLNQKQQRAVRRLRSQMRPFLRPLLHFIQSKVSPEMSWFGLHLTRFFFWKPYRSRISVSKNWPSQPDREWIRDIRRSETVKNSDLRLTIKYIDISGLLYSMKESFSSGLSAWTDINQRFRITFFVCKPEILSN